MCVRERKTERGRKGVHTANDTLHYIKRLVLTNCSNWSEGASRVRWAYLLNELELGSSAGDCRRKNRISLYTRNTILYELHIITGSKINADVASVM